MKINCKVPKTLQKWLDKNPEKVAEVDFGEGYNTDRRDSCAYDILLAPGWSAYDYACHTVIEGTVKDLLSVLNDLQPCDCEDYCKAARK
jgi:hypothetical protein